MFRWLGKRLAATPLIGVAVWLVLSLSFGFMAFCGLGSAGSLFSRLHSDEHRVTNSDSHYVSELLSKPVLTVVVDGIPLDKAKDFLDLPAHLQPVINRVKDISGVESVISPVTAQSSMKNPLTEIETTLQQNVEQAAQSAANAVKMAGGDENAQKQAADSARKAAQAKVSPIYQAAEDKAQTETDKALKQPIFGQSKRSFVVIVNFKKDLPPAELKTANQQALQELKNLSQILSKTEKITIHSTSLLQVYDLMIDHARADLVKGETIGLPIALLLMVIFFGGLLAAGLPLISAIITIISCLGVLYIGTLITSIDSFVINMVSVIGIGLSIDYGLLLVSRFREEAHRLQNELVTYGGLDDGHINQINQVADLEQSVLGSYANKQEIGNSKVEQASLEQFDLPKRINRRMLRKRRKEKTLKQQIVSTATANAVSSAGRTITFSALTIAFSISGLFVFNIDLLKLMGAALVIVVLIAALISLTLLPAIIRLGGEYLLRPSPLNKVPGIKLLSRVLGDTAPKTGVFSRLAALIQKKPWLVLISTVVLMLVLASPILHLGIRNNPTELLPKNSEVYKTLQLLENDYAYFRTADAQLVVKGSKADALAARQAAAKIPMVRSISEPVTINATHNIISIFTNEEDKLSAKNLKIVDELRTLKTPGKLYIAGTAAAQIDFNDELGRGAPWALILMGASIFILLFLMTGSVVVPLKALVVNAFSICTSLAITSFIFQHGIFGLPKASGIQSYVVCVVIAFGFGLAMDYEVFLLARVKEFWDQNRKARPAIIDGLQQTGRIITSAAAIIIAVFIGFVLGNMLAVKQLGVALAVTVAVDATLVRMLLVPALLTILDKWNWWAPSRLEKLYKQKIMEKVGKV